MFRPALSALLVVMALAVVFAQDAPRRRNAIIFVAEGLRHGSVNAADTPALHRIRTNGVYFANSHAVFPSQTMPNAAAIATGHLPGDTGQFSDQIFIGYPVFASGLLRQPPGSAAPDVEDPLVLTDINHRFGGNYMREASLLAYARSYGYNTAAIGKTGAATAQDVSEASGPRGKIREPITIILEGATGSDRGLPLAPATMAMLEDAGLPPAPPPRDTAAGAIAHQQWFADAATKAILPAFARSAEPFVLVFWSGDPERTADQNLKQILDYLEANQGTRDNTNVFVTSDHGFSTVSRREVDAAGRPTQSYSARTHGGFLPDGFLAIDLAHELNLPLFDPEHPFVDDTGQRRYARQRPTGAAAFIGGSGSIQRPLDATVIVAQSSIYVPGNDRALIHRIARFLAAQDYVGGLFVNDRAGRPPGTLRMSDVGLIGSTTLPKPAIVVNFRSFARDPKRPHMTSVMVGATRQHGQTDHGSLARANTFNNMAAIGPDFKRRFVSQSPVSNADVQPTLAHIMRMKIPTLGSLRGRVILEALVAGPATTRFAPASVRSRPSSDGYSTVLMYQVADKRRYLDEACFTKAAKCY